MKNKDIECIVKWSVTWMVECLRSHCSNTKVVYLKFYDILNESPIILGYAYVIVEILNVEFEIKVTKVEVKKFKEAPIEIDLYFEVARVNGDWGRLPFVLSDKMKLSVKKEDFLDFEFRGNRFGRRVDKMLQHICAYAIGSVQMRL